MAKRKKQKVIQHRKRKVGRPKLSNTVKVRRQQQYQKIRKAYNDLSAEKKADITYIQFKNRVLDIRGENYKGKVIKTIPQAIKRITGARQFVPYEQRARMNIVDAVRNKYPETFKRMRNLLRDEKGHFQNIPDQLQYDETSGNYIFTGRDGYNYVVLVTNSPEEITVERI